MGFLINLLNRQNLSVLSFSGSDPKVDGSVTGTPVFLAENYDIKILQSPDDVIQFETQWRNLEKTAAIPSNVFQSFDWCANWINTACKNTSQYSLYIVTISCKNQCKLIWPMMTTCVGPLCLLRWLSEPFSQYGDVLVANTKDKNFLLSLAWEQITKHPTADSIRLRHVRHDANVHQFLTTHAQSDGFTGQAPFLEINKYPTQTAYDQRYSKSQRRRRKRIKSNLQQLGDVNFKHTQKGKSFGRSVNQAITEKRAWLAERGLYSKAIFSDDLVSFFDALSKNGSTLKPIASKLNAGDREISFEIGLRYKGHHFGYITAHDASLTDASPARLHMDLSQRLAIDDGMAAFDLMVPADPHKKTWSSAMVETSDYFSNIKVTGFVYSHFYLLALRPLVRALYKTLPANIRRRITPWI